MRNTSSWPTFEDLLRAHKKCRRRKKISASQLQFERRLGWNILTLQRELVQQKWGPSPYFSFVVLEPKPREIFAAHFADRVVHHLVVAELEKWWLPRFSAHSFACHQGRGPHAALQYLQRHVRRLSQGGRRDVWVLQLDVANFFATISRPVLEALVLPDIRDPNLAAVTRQLLQHDPRINHVRVSKPELYQVLQQRKRWCNQPATSGLPIGNLTSQFFANVLLSGLDHFITRQLRPPAYLRYMDDLTILARTSRELEVLIEPISDWLRSQRHQSINPDKTSITNLRHGINFLGYQVKQESTPKNPAQIFLPPVKKFKIVQAAQVLERQGIPAAHVIDPIFGISSHTRSTKALAPLNARLGQAWHARTYRWRKRLLLRLQEQSSIRVKGEYAAVRKIFFSEELEKKMRSRGNSRCKKSGNRDSLKWCDVLHSQR